MVRMLHSAHSGQASSERRSDAAARLSAPSLVGRARPVGPDPRAAHRQGDPRRRPGLRHRRHAEHHHGADPGTADRHPGRAGHRLSDRRRERAARPECAGRRPGRGRARLRRRAQLVESRRGGGRVPRTRPGPPPGTARPGGADQRHARPRGRRGRGAPGGDRPGVRDAHRCAGRHRGELRDRAAGTRQLGRNGRRRPGRPAVRVVTRPGRADARRLVAPGGAELAHDGPRPERLGAGGRPLADTR
jgi:hypothetical protein